MNKTMKQPLPMFTCSKDFIYPPKPPIKKRISEFFFPELNPIYYHQKTRDINWWLNKILSWLIIIITAAYIVLLLCIIYWQLNQLQQIKII